MNKSLIAITSAVSMTIATSASAADIYVGTGAGQFGTVDSGTGAFTLVGNTPTFFDIAILDDLTGYGLTGGGQLFEINLNNASITLIGSTQVSDNINGLSFDDAGNLFGSGNGLYSIDLGTGAATSLSGNIAGFTSAGDLAYDGSQFFMAGSNGLWSVNADGSSSSFIGSNGFSGSTFGLAYDDSTSTLFGLTGSGQVIDINTLDASATLVSDSGIAVFGADIPHSESVPEPMSALSLLAIGVVVTAKKFKQR